jgi:anti-sigma factor RsiW
MVFNAIFNNISVISWRSVLLVEVTGVPGENHRPVASCDVRYDFRIKTMFGSSLLPVVGRRAHVLFTLFVFVCI